MWLILWVSLTGRKTLLLPTVKRILVVDLPNSGQAAVNYYDQNRVGRRTALFYPATVANTVLGGGYSARLNYEIRIKRGLSYGAGSSDRLAPEIWELWNASSDKKPVGRRSS